MSHLLCNGLAFVPRPALVVVPAGVTVVRYAAPGVSLSRRVAETLRKALSAGRGHDLDGLLAAMQAHVGIAAPRRITGASELRISLPDLMLVDATCAVIEAGGDQPLPFSRLSLREVLQRTRVGDVVHWLVHAVLPTPVG